MNKIVDGVSAPLTAAEVAALQSLDAEIVEGRDRVIAERFNSVRDRLIDGGVEYMGKHFQTRPDDRENIKVEVDDARANPGNTYQWIVSDNSIVTLTAEEMIGLGDKVKNHKRFYIFKCAELKVRAKSEDLNPEDLGIWVA